MCCWLGSIVRKVQTLLALAQDPEHVAGRKVKAGLRKRRPGGGHPGKYLLSGLLKCGTCAASFVLSNGTRYQCSSHHEGGNAVCDVSLSDPRSRVESVIMECVETDLLDPQRLKEIEQRYRASAASAIVIDHGPRIAELDREIRNIGDAIANGLVSAALAARLQAAEAERGRLMAARAKLASEPRRRSLAREPALRHRGGATRGGKGGLRSRD